MYRKSPSVGGCTWHTATGGYVNSLTLRYRIMLNFATTLWLGSMPETYVLSKLSCDCAFLRGVGIKQWSADEGRTRV